MFVDENGCEYVTNVTIVLFLVAAHAGIAMLTASGTLRRNKVLDRTPHTDQPNLKSLHEVFVMGMERRGGG